MDPALPYFIATKPFDPSAGDPWRSYVDWSHLTQLEELVSLDGLLCPTILPDIKDDYWPHIVKEDFMLHFFTDFDFLMTQVAEIAPKNVLCVFRDPTEPPSAPPFGDFQFLGYDLADRQSSISALTNCGGFPEIFANSELSNTGLLTNFDRAVEVRNQLRARHPDDPHADCHLWAIFRLVGRES